MFIGYERVDVDTTVKTQSALTISAKATHAELQADGADVLYTMDNATNPSAALPRGMILQNGEKPETFLIEDVKRIRFTTAATAGLNLHYFAGRDI